MFEIVHIWETLVTECTYELAWTKFRKSYCTTPGVNDGVSKMLQFLCLSFLRDGQGPDMRAILSLWRSCFYFTVHNNLSTKIFCKFLKVEPWCSRIFLYKSTDNHLTLPSTRGPSGSDRSPEHWDYNTIFVLDMNLLIFCRHKITEPKW